MVNKTIVQNITLEMQEAALAAARGIVPSGKSSATEQALATAREIKPSGKASATEQALAAARKIEPQ